MSKFKRYCLALVGLGLFGLHSPAVAEASEPTPQSLLSLTGNFRLRLPKTGMYLNVRNQSTADGAIFQQFRDTPRSNERLAMQAVGGGHFRWVMAHSNKCMDIAAGSARQVSPVIQASCSAQRPQQEFHVNSVGHGQVQVRDVLGGRCLMVDPQAPGGSWRENAPLVLAPCANSDVERWQIVDESGGAVTRALTAVKVYLGGTLSEYQRWGMGGIAAPQATAHFRAHGGQLYIHELGWVKTSDGDQRSLRNLFPGKPIWETGSVPQEILNNFRYLLLPHWPQGASITCTNGWFSYGPNNAGSTLIDANTVADLRRRAQGSTEVIGPYASPNFLGMGRWEDGRYDSLRALLQAGGALCIDAPPAYYFNREEAYREFTAASIRWAKQRNIKVVVTLFPFYSGGAQPTMLADSRKFVQDLEHRDARPDVYAGNVYASDVTTPFPLGAETDPRTLTSVADQLLTQERGNYPFWK